MSLDMPINNSNICHLGSQQSLPDMYMPNEEKELLSSINQSDIIINETFASLNYNDSNVLSTNFRTVKSLSGIFKLFLIIFFVLCIICRYKKFSNIIYYIK